MSYLITLFGRIVISNPIHIHRFTERDNFGQIERYCRICWTGYTGR